jgi:hypothetical protein
MVNRSFGGGLDLDDGAGLGQTVGELLERSTSFTLGFRRDLCTPIGRL